MKLHPCIVPFDEQTPHAARPTAAQSQRWRGIRVLVLLIVCLVAVPLGTRAANAVHQGLVQELSGPPPILGVSVPSELFFHSWQCICRRAPCYAEFIDPTDGSTYVLKVRYGFIIGEGSGKPWKGQHRYCWELNDPDPEPVPKTISLVGVDLEKLLL